MAKTISTMSTSANVAYYNNVKYSSIQQLHKKHKMHGAKRVIAFCICIVILPATLIIIPLYLRHSVFADVTYPVAESDIIEIRDGISSIFCEQHSLHMNVTFNAFQLQSKPEISRNRKHIRLKKSMTLPDDTLEYWGFYLLKGAIVELKVCSRYDGSRILLVKGDRNLNTCGLLEHNKDKFGAHFAQGYDKVQVTFETVAEVVVSEEERKISSNSNNNNDNNNFNDSQNSSRREMNESILNDNGNDYKNQHSNHHHPHHRHHHHQKISTEEMRSTGDYQNEENHHKTDNDDDDDEDENHGGEDFTTGIEDNIDDIGDILKPPLLKNDNRNLNPLKKKNVIVVKKQKFDNKAKVQSNNGNDQDTENNRYSSKTENLLNMNSSHEHQSSMRNLINPTTEDDGDDAKLIEANNLKKIRHRRHYNKLQHQYKKLEEEEHLKFVRNEHERKKKKIMKQLYEKVRKKKENNQKDDSKTPSSSLHQRHSIMKRDTVYDAKIAHGGNALNFTENESNSVSSFENSLLTCYDGQILLAQSFNPSSLCTSVNYLANGTHMIARHEVEEDGYYYYIFYSDNDFIRNDIHAVFDIYKPTYQYTNVTDSKGCVNGTNCTFPIHFLSDEIVVVEVPTRDGIEHEEDDITYLISTCHPRMSIYLIFPIMVLVLILSCSFL